MKRIASLLCLLLVATALATAQSFDSETLRYDVVYKWGLVNKKAGSVVISLDATPSRYDCLLTAASASWADHFFKVRDTLTCVIDREGYRPQRYVKRSHEGGTYEHNVVTYEYGGPQVLGHCTRYREKDGVMKNDDRHTLSAEGLTLDMFSAFYYMRSLPYQNWSTGHTVKLNIFSGKRKELLTIHYQGREEVKWEGSRYDCYKITFTFTSDGKTKTSDDMKAWISCAPSRVPIKLEGKLPVGSVRCYLRSGM